MTTTTTTTTTTTVVTETVVTTASGPTRLLFVLDRSGSMEGIKNEAKGGFNAFVDGQKKVEGEAVLSLVLFDNFIEKVYNLVPLSSVEVLTENVYFPRGMTSLYDAIGVTITEALNDKTPYVKTILAILTDGAENSSQEYSGKAVADLIKTVETEHKWDVLFLGANIDVQSIAKDLNIQSGKFASFAASSKGISDSFAAVNNVTAMYRSAAVSGQAFSANELNLQAQYDNLASK